MRDFLSIALVAGSPLVSLVVFCPLSAFFWVGAFSGQITVMLAATPALRARLPSLGRRFIPCGRRHSNQVAATGWSRPERPFLESRPFPSFFPFPFGAHSLEERGLLPLISRVGFSLPRFFCLACFPDARCFRSSGLFSRIAQRQPCAFHRVHVAWLLHSFSGLPHFTPSFKLSRTGITAQGLSLFPRFFHEVLSLFFGRPPWCGRPFASTRLFFPAGTTSLRRPAFC